jgi:hypothetical protein
MPSLKIQVNYELTTEQIVALILHDMRNTPNLTLNSIQEKIQTKLQLRQTVITHVYKYGSTLLNQRLTEDQVLNRQDVISILKGILP